jgi:hypothetical protein
MPKRGREPQTFPGLLTKLRLFATISCQIVSTNLYVNRGNNGHYVEHSNLVQVKENHDVRVTRNEQ